MKRSVQIMAILGALEAAGGLPAAAAQAGSWKVGAFGGTQVSFVKANARNPKEMVAIAGGVLQISHDGGSTWIPGFLPVPARSVAYDMVYSGRLYAGTGNGLYVSDTAGMTWRPFGASITSRKIVTALQITDEYVFAAMYDGGGTPVRLWRFDASGEARDMNLPSNNAAAFDYDFGARKLFVGAAGGVYYSGDQGASWGGGGRGAGQFTLDLAVKPGLIWQLSADGLFRSNDDGASWNKLAGPGNINGTFYGNSMHVSGLAVSGNRAFYGAWSIGFPYRFLVEYDGSGARSLLDAKVASVAISGTRVWAASETGLWVSDVPMLNQPRVQRPVLLIPGILGSMPTTTSLASYLPKTFIGAWDHLYQTPFVLDPLNNTYDGLIESLEKQGFVVGNTLFAFPYNWLQDNAKTAVQLSQKLHDIRQLCKCSHIDVVAHSMGGLVARSYVTSNYYQNDIRNLILLGTPNAGSVAAYEVWEGGSSSVLKDSANQLLNFVAQALTDPTIASPRASALRASIPSVGQLLPVFDYLAGRRYPEGYPVNLFLDHLNLPSEIARLKDRVALHIVGVQSRATIQSLTVSAANETANVWPHGKILASSYGPGDGTVLRTSLEAAAKSSLLLDAGHLQLVSAAAPFILQTLMGEYVPDVSIPLWPPQRFLAVYASGPVALSLASPSGHRVDDANSAIPGAYYSGSSIKPQLAIIPYEQGGDYIISLRAVESGVYRIGVEAINAYEADQRPANATETHDVATLTKGQVARYAYQGNAMQLIRLDKPAPVGDSATNATPLSLGASSLGKPIIQRPTDTDVVLFTDTVKKATINTSRQISDLPPPEHRHRREGIHYRILIAAAVTFFICALLIITLFRHR